jgi:hypothetical protein
MTFAWQPTPEMVTRQDFVPAPEPAVIFMPVYRLRGHWRAHRRELSQQPAPQPAHPAHPEA